jgi:hypothetical protein
MKIIYSKIKMNNMENNMTAVDWLENELQINLKHIILNQDNNMMESLFEQAKTIQREQRIKDYNMGYTDAQCNHINDAENYVNEQEYIS